MREYMLWNLYLRKGIVFIPTVSKTEAGFYLDTEPVEVVPVQDIARLEIALKNTINKGNPVVPTPTRDNFPKPVVLKYSNTKSWSSFEKNAFCFSLKRNKVFEVMRLRRSPNGGWEVDPDNLETVSLDMGIDAVIKKLIAMILNTC
jgi:hypothetical protein